MAILGREFIAVPDEKKSQIVFKWPDVSIRRYTRAIVNADELALFVNTGKVVAQMGPGRHQVDADEIPGLGIFIDAATAGRAYRAELYFVGTREFPGFTFGGRIDDVQDVQTGLIVTLRVFGDYAVRVIDPVALITNLVGTVDVTDNGQISGWVSDQLLKVMRAGLTTQVVRNGWPVLGLAAYNPEIEQATIAAANGQLAPYGIALTRMGNFVISLAPQDEEHLKQLARDTSYSRLAGSFGQYAAGEMQLGAGAGMALGGGATSSAFMAAGFGAVGAATQTPPAPPPASGFAGGAGGGYVGPPPAGAAPAAVACSACGTANPAGAKFCVNCGTGLAPRPRHCTQCGSELPPGAKFCAGCGTPVPGAPAGAPPAAAPSTPTPAIPVPPAVPATAVPPAVPTSPPPAQPPAAA